MMHITTVTPKTIIYNSC